MNRCMRCQITGRVQGVWFRGSTQEQALRLGLNGYAKNLHDGSVEVVACGAETALAELKTWLWQGPRLAQVATVMCEAYSGGEYASFTTE